MLKRLLICISLLLLCTGCNQKSEKIKQPKLTHIKTLDKFAHHDNLSSYKMVDGIYYFEETEDDLEQQTMYTRKIYAYDMQKDTLKQIMEVKENIRIMDCIQYKGRILYSYYIPSGSIETPLETKLIEIENGKEKVLLTGNVWNPFETPTIQVTKDGIYYMNAN